MNYLDTAMPGPLAVAPIEDERAKGDPTLVRYWRAVLRWKWLIAAIITLTMLAGLGLTLLMQPTYTAVTRISIERPQQAVQTRGVQDRGSPLTEMEYYQTQYGLLKARSLAERVSRSLNLPASREFVTAFGLDASPGAATPGQQPGATQGAVQRLRSDTERVIGILLGNIEVAPVRGSSLVDISFTSPNPALSAQIANEWVRQYAEARTASRFASSADSRRFLETRLNEMRQRLETSERDLVSYAADREIITLRTSEGQDGQTRTEQTLTAVNLEALNQELAAATAARTTAESRLSAGARGSSPNALNNTTINTLRQRRAELTAEYERLLVQFAPEYPAARQIAVQVRRLDGAIAAEEARVQGGYQAEFNQAQQREQSLQQRVSALTGRLIGQQRDSIQYNIFQREVDTNRQLYDALLQRYRELGVEGVGLTNVAVVDAAEVPRAPSSPNLPLNLLLAMAVGTMLAALAVFALVQVDESIRDPADVSNRLSLPLLGAIPAVRPDMVADDLTDPKSPLFESYLSTFTHLEFATDHGFPKSLMVTSGRPAEGKTTTSVALALVLARTGRKVVLVDGDMRLPSLHNWVDGNNDRGLSHFLAGDDNWRSLLRPFGQASLMVMPAGPQPPNAAELLKNDRLRELLRSLLTEFDHVIVDAPPVLGLADAPALAATVEGVAYVIQANGMRVRALTAAIDRLRSARANILGAILTKYSAETGYGGGYAYSYGYGDTAKKKEPARVDA